LTFRNAAVDAGVAAAPRAYAVAWKRFDNASGTTTELEVTTAPAPRVAAPNGLPTSVGSYVCADISAVGGPDAWSAPAQACFRREATGWMLVGFQRTPGGNPPARQTRRSAPDRQALD
jgi:hypothetical protein